MCHNNLNNLNKLNKLNKHVETTESKDAGQPITRRLFAYQLAKSTIAGPPSNLKSRTQPDHSVNIGCYFPSKSQNP